ncbi:hypothetical protein [Thiolapillus sp.]
MKELSHSSGSLVACSLLPKAITKELPFSSPWLTLLCMVVFVKS